MRVQPASDAAADTPVRAALAQESGFQAEWGQQTLDCKTDRHAARVGEGQILRIALRTVQVDAMMILMHSARDERRQQQWKPGEQVPGCLEAAHAASEMADFVHKKKAAVKREGSDYRGHCHEWRKQ